MNGFTWLLIALGTGFFAYLLYTKQFKWMFSVVRNMVLGVIAILGLNALLYGVVPLVGVNAITTLIVGLLGLPGVVFLYVTRLIVG